MFIYNLPVMVNKDFHYYYYYYSAWGAFVEDLMFVSGTRETEAKGSDWSDSGRPIIASSLELD